MTKRTETYDEYCARLDRARTSTDPDELHTLATADDARWNREVQKAAIKNPAVRVETLRAVRRRYRGAWCMVALMGAPAAHAHTLAQIGPDWAPLPRGAFAAGHLILTGLVEIRGETAGDFEFRLAP